MLIAFDHIAGLIVQVGADPSRGFDVVVALEELIELCQAGTKILHAHRAVLVEIEAQVVVLHEDLHI